MTWIKEQFLFVPVFYLPISCVCVRVFITFFLAQRGDFRDLVTPVIYLVAYLLKDLTLEVFTQPP